ncbi:MAG: LacI family DNA-binding transcriptional regulator [Candidatus Omnitrophica bacterium]|nr:LacI family DNA-binding transcriptional regulator [Candidatus Omnitrophota bacterium]MCB9747229.1 LacI family DNA-binding transcriptional regulator [Candidatus Omnitrophota bacterium]
MTDKKVSIEDVAKRANVSITTVSRVINNVSTVSNKNRAKVEEAIAFLKFKPNISAQRLARGTNNSIGLVMPGYPGIFHSFYAIELIRGVGHACESLRLDMLFHITNGYNPINTNNVGGVLFADIIENRKQVEAAIANGTPCMIINNKVTDLKTNYIAVDNTAGGQIAADYLSSFGHKNIAVITGNLNTQSGLERFEGFKDFLKTKNIEIPKDYIFQGDYSRRSARVAMEKFLELKPLPTAIFAASDDMALETIAVILEKGMRVPEDISVIGFDDNPACLFGPVALTTIRQPLFEMADEGVKSLNSIIQGKTKSLVKTLLKPELVIRESCTTPKGQ